MNIIDLYEHNLTELTEEQLINLCQLKDFKPKKLKVINLSKNKLIDLNFIKKNICFINIKELWIDDNEIKDISNVKYLPNLENLNISNLKLDNEKETLEQFKNIKRLKSLYCYNIFNGFFFNCIAKRTS